MYLNAANIIKYIVLDPSQLKYGKPAQVGYDLTVCDIKQIHGGAHSLSVSGSNIDKTAYEGLPLASDVNKPKERHWILGPGVYSLTFHQGCKLPNNVKAEIIHRSSLLRMGVEVKSAVYDPGFKVEQMGAVMIVHNNITIEYGSRVAQIIMSETQIAEEYDGQFQDTKDVK